ncbi:MAG: ribosome biogenesis GTPase YlqF [Eubacteriales bacterium]|nr:ribosome biogenesis GTPase YlqF [Eubacteriales bacterium]
MNIQWYPGHMAKTKRLIKEKLSLIDVVVELLDARLPLSSRNPDMEEICGNKPRVIALNKSDMADEEVTKKWVEWYASKGIKAVPICSISGNGIQKLKDEVSQVMQEKRQRDEARGMTGRSIKMMVVGIPNVGKSAFVNKIAGRAGAVTGDRPGVTKHIQWIRVPGGYELMDTPGVLWPKFDDEETALNLAFTGAIKDEIMDVEELAVKVCGFLRKHYPEEFADRYKFDIEDTVDMQDYEILEVIAKNRGCIISGGEFDYFRASNILLDELRGMKLGKVSFERPDDIG